MVEFGPMQSMVPGFPDEKKLQGQMLKDVHIKQDGVVLAQGFIRPNELVALGAELAAGAKAAEKVRL